MTRKPPPDPLTEPSSFSFAVLMGLSRKRFGEEVHGR